MRRRGSTGPDRRRVPGRRRGSRRGQPSQSPTPARHRSAAVEPSAGGRTPVQPPETRTSPPAGGVGSSTSPATGRAAGPAAGRWCGRGPCAAPRGGRRKRGVEAVEQRVHLGQRRRPGPAPAGPPDPTGNPVRYQPACLRNWRIPRSSPNEAAQQLERGPASSADLAQAGRGLHRPPRKASARSRNSHGRPRQPRPTTTPSHPVAATMARASDASHRSPLPRTGMVVTACLEPADGPPVGRARSRAARRCGRAG